VWRNILDIGISHPDADMDVTASSSSVSPSTARKKAQKRDGSATLNRLEVQFIDALREKGLPAYTEFGSQELRIARDGKVPMITASERQAFVRGRNPYSTFHQLDCGFSESGDMGFVYGTAEAVGPERRKPATYVRIWKREPSGWRIVVDVLAIAE
jgi:ketosteroid isomerase-like protein